MKQASAAIVRCGNLPSQLKLTVCKCGLKIIRFAPLLSQCLYSTDFNLLLEFFCGFLMNDSEFTHSLLMSLLRANTELHLIKRRESAFVVSFSACPCCLSLPFFSYNGWSVLERNNIVEKKKGNKYLALECALVIFLLMFRCNNQGNLQKKKLLGLTLS